MSARAVWGRVMDALYAASDASHRVRGWEVCKGRFGSRRYRLDVAAWLEKHYPGRVHLRFTPTKAAWLNLIEAWWTIFSRDLLRGAQLASRAQFREAVRRYVGYWNREPTAFVWGRRRPKRCFRAGPLRRGRLRGRAPVGNLGARFLRRLAVAGRVPARG